MRKSLFTLSLIALAFLASTAEVLAQRVQIGGRNGVSIGVGFGGYYNNSPYYYGNRGYNSGYRYSYAPGYSYPTRSYYYATPSYYYEPAVQVAPTVIRQSFYTEPNAANITVLVPAADAEVWFENAPTTQRGMERTFHSPPLQPGTYTYTIRARWTENGRSVEQQRQVQVQAGQSVTVDFRNPVEKLPAPRSPEQ